MAQNTKSSGGHVHGHRVGERRNGNPLSPSFHARHLQESFPSHEKQNQNIGKG